MNCILWGSTNNEHKRPRTCLKFKATWTQVSAKHNHIRRVRPAPCDYRLVDLHKVTRQVLPESDRRQRISRWNNTGSSWHYFFKVHYIMCLSDYKLDKAHEHFPMKCMHFTYSLSSSARPFQRICVGMTHTLGVVLRFLERHTTFIYKWHVWGINWSLKIVRRENKYITAS